MKVHLANAEFNCRVLGNGDKIVIAFHGFGQDGSYYEKILDFHHDLTIYALDLPFHGSTIVQKRADFYLTPGQIHQLVQEILYTTGKSTFSVLAFSIGVRLVFPVVEKYHDHIDQLVLLAPDGLVENFWYHIATRTVPSRFLFRKILKNFSILKWTGTLLSKLRLLDKRSLQFALRSLDTGEKREKVYYTWVALRLLRSDVSHFTSLLNENGINVRVFVGAKDSIIKKSAVKPFLLSVENATLITLPCGHSRIIDCFAEQKVDVL